MRDLPGRYACERSLRCNLKARDWIKARSFVSVKEHSFAEAGLNPDCFRGANTPEEWAKLARMTDLM